MTCHTWYKGIWWPCWLIPAVDINLLLITEVNKPFFLMISKSESQRSEISWTLVEMIQNRGCGKDHETNCTQLFTWNRKFEIHGNRKRQKISMCGSIFLHANLVQNIVKVFWIFDSLVSQRGAIWGKTNLHTSKILPSKLFDIFSFASVTHQRFTPGNHRNYKWKKS